MALNLGKSKRKPHLFSKRVQRLHHGMWRASLQLVFCPKRRAIIVGIPRQLSGEGGSSNPANDVTCALNFSLCFRAVLRSARREERGSIKILIGDYDAPTNKI